MWLTWQSLARVRASATTFSMARDAGKCTRTDGTAATPKPRRTHQQQQNSRRAVVRLARWQAYALNSVPLQENGVRSALYIADQLGVACPWAHEAARGKAYQVCGLAVLLLVLVLCW
jgi:hypothetical protein